MLRDANGEERKGIEIKDVEGTYWEITRYIPLVIPEIHSTR